MRITKQTIEQTIRQSFKDWQLDTRGWTFKWNKSKRCFGTCYHSRRLIVISEWLFDNTISSNKVKFIDTVYHEVAHALAGFKAGHGHEWQEWALLLGAEPVRCGSVEKIDPMAGVKYVMQYDGEIVNTYFRKPSYRTIKTLARRYLTGIPESVGKLKIAKVCKVGKLTIYQEIT